MSDGTGNFVVVVRADNPEQTTVYGPFPTRIDAESWVGDDLCAAEVYVYEVENPDTAESYFDHVALDEASRP